jgi:hypothetical protein
MNFRFICLERNLSYQKQIGIPSKNLYEISAFHYIF